MINGVVGTIKLGEQTQFVLAAVIESGSIERKTRNEAPARDQMKRIYSEISCSAVILGDNMGRSLLSCHRNCSKSNCQCELIAADYLFNSNCSTEEFLATNSEIIKSIIISPILLLFILDGEITAVSLYGKNDLHVQKLPQAIFIIRDCLLMSPVLTGNSIEAYNRISSGEGVLDAAKTLILEQSKLSICWPKYCGTGLFMSTNGFQFKNTIHVETVIPRIIKAMPKIKCPVTAFNYYLKERVVILREKLELSTNAMNRYVGEEWKALPEELKKPYRSLAADDKIRHEKENSTATNPSISAEALSAYNLFVRQEKQYLVGLDIPLLQTKTGKHSGQRWDQMGSGEKEQYHVLREVQGH